MIKIVLLQNTIIKSKRYVAGDVVELEDDVAQKFCDRVLGHPLFLEDLEKMGMSIDEDAIITEEEVANGGEGENDGKEAEETKKPNYHFMKLEDLKKLAEKKGIDVTGLKKDEIIARLKDETDGQTGDNNDDPEKGNK